MGRFVSNVILLCLISGECIGILISFDSNLIYNVFDLKKKTPIEDKLVPFQPPKPFVLTVIGVLKGSCITED
jgi:hypothetical protein